LEFDPLVRSTFMRRSALALIAGLTMALAAAADDWPQWLGPRRDGVWRESGIVDKLPEGGPKVRWRAPIGGGYAGPAVANGKVLVADRMLAKDANKPKHDFDRATAVAGTERIVCLNEADGKVIWVHEYPCAYRISYAAGPRCTPILDGDRVYTLGAMGDLKCLNAADGKVIWQKNFINDFGQQPPVWGWSANPLVDGDKLICMVGGSESTVVAFDKNTGAVRWKALTAAEPGYCPPMIYTFSGTRQLIIWHPEAVNGLDLQTGRVFWSVPFRLQSGLAIPTPRQIDGDKLFVTSFYNGPMLLRVTGGSQPKAEVLWRGNSNSEQPTRTDKLHAIMCTPIEKDGYLYGVCSYGQLRCLKVSDGSRVWETLEAAQPRSDRPLRPVRWANAFIVAHGERYFLFNEAGELIIAQLSPEGYRELSRAQLVEPTLATMGRDYVWTHPAFANRCVFARNDKEIVCVSLADESARP
jgi:outer membrane protein assembly factor BamB